MNRVFSLIFAAFCTLTSIIAAGAAEDPAAPSEIPKEAQSTVFTSKRYGFELTYPSEFEVVVNDSLGLGLSLRSRGGGFPTLTITVHPGDFSVKDIEDASARMTRAEQIAASYRNIGFTDAKISEVRTIRRSALDESALVVDLQYTKESKPFKSRVTVIPGDSMHYILTFIDDETSFAEHSLSLTSVVQSFVRFEALPQNSPRTLYPKRDRFAIILSGLVTLFALGFILWHHQRKEQALKSKKS